MNDYGLTLDRQRRADRASTRMPTPRGARIAIQVIGFALHIVRVLILATLAVLEPFVRFILTTLAALGMFVTIVFGFLIGAQGFPKWFMLEMSVGCFLVLGAYYGLMSLFGNVTNTHDLR